VRFNGARAFVDATQSVVPPREAISAPAQLQLPTVSEKNVSLPASTSTRPRRRQVVVAGTDLKKLSNRRSKARVATVEAVDPDVDAEGLLDESLYARLESAYRQPSFATLMSDFEAHLGNSILKDDEILNAPEPSPESDIPEPSPSQSSAIVDAPEPSSSELSAESAIALPKTVKRRRRTGNRILKITKSPATRRPSPEPVSEEEKERGGKRRLSLRSRIAMKQSKHEVPKFESLSPEDQALWSPEVDDLINNYSSSLDLTAPLWDKLDRGLLTAAEENRLAMHMKPMKKLEKLHSTLTKQLGKEPTDEEWASAAGVELSVLRRRLALGRAARIKLIQRNLRLVLSQAYKYYKESMSLSIQDLCQEGVVGLMQAVDKFDPGKGYRFSTYGIYWIRNSILRAQTKSGHMLRSPHNVSTHMVNIKRTKIDLTAELGRTPTNEEIRKHLGLSEDRFRDILRTNIRTSSIHEHDRVTGRERVENLASEEDALSMYARGTSMVQYGIDDVLDSLRPKENLVLRQRFGLDGKGQRSLSEVGLILNLSREMVRRHELRGILKLKHPTRVEYLRKYLN